MQKLIFSAAFCCIVATSLSACAQDSHLEHFYQKYQSSNADGSVNLSMSPSFLLNACFNSDDKPSADGGWIQKISNLRLLFVDAKKNLNARQEWADLEQSLAKDRFEDLITVRKGTSEKMRLLSKDGPGTNKEVAFLVTGQEGSGMFFQFSGHFTAKDLDAMQMTLQSHNNQ